MILEINLQNQFEELNFNNAAQKSGVKPQLNLIKFSIRPKKLQHKIASGNDFDKPHNIPQPAWVPAPPLV